MIKLSLSEVAKRIKGIKNALILCHKNPDPDTLGSAFGLKHIFEHLGVSARVACCDKASAKFDFITGGYDLTSDFAIDEFDGVIAIDVASVPQLGDYSYLSDKVSLIIDHHESCTRFCDYYEDFASACAMIVFDIAKELGIFEALPSHFYECVYAGLSGDTGCFKYSNTTKKALTVASELVDTGIDFANINYIIFDCKSVGEISAQCMVYSCVELFEDKSLAIALITNEMKEKHGVCDDDIADIISSVRQIEGVRVAVTIKQSSRDEKKFSISSRANCDIDVSKICAEIGGGGHPRAAGAMLEGVSPSEAFDIIRNLFAKGMKTYAK
jgi:phosphoesterase RecJ-like protein